MKLQACCGDSRESVFLLFFLLFSLLTVLWDRDLDPPRSSSMLSQPVLMIVVLMCQTCSKHITHISLIFTPI